MTGDMKTIWIINHYAGLMLSNKGGRHYWMAKYLRKAGYKTVIICSNAIQQPNTFISTDGKWGSLLADEIETPFVFIKARQYTGNGKARALNMLDFYRNLILSGHDIAKRFGVPDVILASSVHPLAPVAGIKLGKSFNKPCICEYRDLWPEELISMGSLRQNGIVANVMRLIEHWTYKKADALVFTMEGAVQYIRDQKWDKESGGDVDLSKAYYINNGVDLPSFNNNLESFQLNDPDLEDDKRFKVVYTGSINRANGIDKIFEIAEKLTDNENIVFLIYGAGNDEKEIKERIEKGHIPNVVFKGFVKRQYVPYILSKCNITLLNYLSGDLFRYGCSNNKLFEYMAAGNPILCNVSMNYSILTRYNCGLEVGDGDTDKMAAFIRELYDCPEKAAEYRKNCQRAITAFDFSTYAEKIDEIVKSVM